MLYLPIQLHSGASHDWVFGVARCMCLVAMRAQRAIIVSKLKAGPGQSQQDSAFQQAHQLDELIRARALAQPSFNQIKMLIVACRCSSQRRVHTSDEAW